MDNLDSNQPQRAPEATPIGSDNTSEVRGDTTMAIDYLRAMHPEGPWALTAIDPEKKAGALTSTFFPSTEIQARAFIERWNGHRNLYFAVNHPRTAMSKKAKATDIASLAYLHVDIDPNTWTDDAGVDRAAFLDQERKRILDLLLDKLPGGVPKPTAIVFSGGGYQAFWKLAEPLLLDSSEEEAEKAKLWNMQLELLFGGDHCHNIDRVMRLPGTVNIPDEKKRKKGRMPALAVVVSADWSRVYAIDCFTAATAASSAGAVSAIATDAVSVDDSTELVNFVDVNDLDKHTIDGQPLDDRVKRIVQDGRDGLDDRVDGKPQDDRSRWLFDAVCSLVRRGVPDNVILSVLLNRGFRISDHVYDRKGDTRKYAIRQIARAKTRVEMAEAEFEVDKNGRPLKQSQRNVEVALAKLNLSIKLDAFRNRMLVEGLETTDVVIDDRIMTRLRLEADRRFKFLCEKIFFFDVVGDLAFRNAYHPVRDYLDSLTWDGVARLDDWLVRHCGAEDSEYVRAVGRIVLLAAVRRVRRPGVKFDEMLVLEGAQGLGKSQVLQALAVKEEWFTDEVPLAGDGKLAIEALSGRWIAEAAELKGMRNKEVEHLKGFLSRTHDRGRLAYDRMTSEMPRQFIVIGTTNSEQYLMDSTGNRRFWPVRVTRVDLSAFQNERDQLWAEAAQREATGESIRLAEELWAAAAAEQGKRQLDDPYLTALAEALEGRWGKIASEDVFRLLGINSGQRNQGHNARIGEAMRRLGWRRERLRREGTLQYCYLNCKTQDAPWLNVVEDAGRFFIACDRLPERQPDRVTELPF